MCEKETQTELYINQRENQLDISNCPSIAERENQLTGKIYNILILNKINHKLIILKELSLKHAHIYCFINRLSGQKSGPLIEHYIIEKNFMKRNKSYLLIGDANYNNTNYEIKISIGGADHDKFNYVQLRMNHECDYILTAYFINEDNLINNGELFIFLLTKSDIKNIILKHGSYAHGTNNQLGKITEENLTDVSNNKEYAIRPKYGDKCWLDLLDFRINEI